MKRLEKLGISPAPWRIDKDSSGWIIVRDANEKYAATPDGDEETEAISNARLIAAAPKLYECLREAVLEMCHECLSCGGYSSYECKDPNDRCFLAKWRAALAEAAGEEVGDGQSS